MNTTTNRKPLLASYDDIARNPLATYETVKVSSRQLRSGMVMVDDMLGTPEVVLVRREGALPGGRVAWSAACVNSGHIVEVTFPVTLAQAIPVAAA